MRNADIRNLVISTKKSLHNAASKCNISKHMRCSHKQTSEPTSTVAYCTLCCVTRANAFIVVYKRFQLEEEMRNTIRLHN